MHNRKLEIVQHLIPKVPIEYQQSIDHAMKTWWVNIRKDGGMRLTDAGYEILNDILRIPSWTLDLPDQEQSGAWRARISKKTILEMDRRLQWPYYLDFNVRKKRRRIIFFSSREAMMATMYGDIDLFLSHFSM